jgi:hypothetical protein
MVCMNISVAENDCNDLDAAEQKRNKTNKFWREIQIQNIAKMQHASREALTQSSNKENVANAKSVQTPLNRPRKALANISNTPSQNKKSNIGETPTAIRSKISLKTPLQQAPKKKRRAEQIPRDENAKIRTVASPLKGPSLPNLPFGGFASYDPMYFLEDDFSIEVPGKNFAFFHFLYFVYRATRAGHVVRLKY